MSSVTVDNRALYLGANNKVKSTLEVPAGAERTIVKGTALVQKTAEGDVLELHSENLTLPIQGTLLNDLLVAADGGVTSHTIERVIDGHIDQKIFVANNSLANIDVIPAGGTFSYRMQLENKGMIPIFRENL